MTAMQLVLIALLFVFSLVSAGRPPYDPWAPKRGLAFNDPPQYISHFTENSPVGAHEPSQIRWAYSWSSHMDDNFPEGLEFVPMLWDNRQANTDPWWGNAWNALSRGSNHILSFNEPDSCGYGQACMSPQDAANAYIQYMNPWYGAAYLGAPAVTNGPGGLQWLQDFLGACNGRCNIDFIPIHWYANWDNYEYFRDYLIAANHIAGSLNLWVTEFHVTGDIGQQMHFLDQAMPFMDYAPWVSHYSWFWANPRYDDGALANWDGTPTELGHYYTYRGF